MDLTLLSMKKFVWLHGPSLQIQERPGIKSRNDLLMLCREARVGNSRRSMVEMNKSRLFTFASLD